MRLAALLLSLALAAASPSPPPASPEPTPRLPVVHAGDKTFEVGPDAVILLDEAPVKVGEFLVRVRKVTVIEVHAGRVVRLEGTAKGD